MSNKERRKIGILGRGKTGSQVARLCEEEGREHEVFHSENPLTSDALKNLCGLVIFIPGPALKSFLPMILESGLPVVSGATGIAYDEEFSLKAKNASLPWIQGHNFSLGMNIIHRVIKVLSESSKLFGKNIPTHIHEIHHTKKLDAPSGTAIRWNEWLGLDSQLTSERTGDVVGFHSLKMDLPSETITLTHEAHDRGVFAAGALWAMDYAIEHSPNPGLIWFEDLALKELFS